MADNLPLTTLHRPEFFAGQVLTAADLTALQEYHRTLRWMHNRLFHTAGVATGYMVSGAKGDRSVKVMPGLALDGMGREILLVYPVDLPIPPAGQQTKYYLTAAYPDDDVLRANAQPRDGACGTSGAVRLPERAVIRWRKQADLRSGLDIILATTVIENCKIAGPLLVDERQTIHATRRPKVAGGQTWEGATAWSFWKKDPGDFVYAGVQVIVDTSIARFDRTPSYQAHVMGDRHIRFSDSTPTFVDGPCHIANPKPDQFTLRMTILVDQTAITTWPTSGTPTSSWSAAATPEHFRDVGWYVTWMGVED